MFPVLLINRSSKQLFLTNGHIHIYRLFGMIYDESITYMFYMACHGHDNHGVSASLDHFGSPLLRPRVFRRRAAESAAALLAGPRCADGSEIVLCQGNFDSKGGWWCWRATSHGSHWMWKTGKNHRKPYAFTRNWKVSCQCSHHSILWFIKRMFVWIIWGKLRGVSLWLYQMGSRDGWTSWTMKTSQLCLLVYHTRLSSDWWYTYPPLKKIWARQLGWWNSQYTMESHKIHVPNHQSNRYIYYNYG